MSFLRKGLFETSIPLRKNRLVLQGGKVLLIPKTPGKRSAKFPTEDAQSGWTIDSKRTGSIGIKLGMTMDWDNFGVLRPLTLIKFEDVQVLQIKTKEKDGYDSVQLGAVNSKLKHTSQSLMGLFAKAGTPPKKFIEEFRITPDAAPAVGTEITASHFVPGQLLNITGTSKGKGFQGVMKRWGFGGGRASHGASLSHRIPGSTGARQNPSKVWKGKKMPGHMGSERVHVPNVRVVEVYPELNTIAVHGSVPGANGSKLRLADALTNIFPVVPPFPTHVEGKGEKQPEVLTYHWSNPWHHVPDLEEYYWKSFATKSPEKLLNGKWEPTFRANLGNELLETAKKRLAEAKKKQNK